VQQGATTIRSQRASTVVEVGEEESVTAVTEVIANYNHCHALTIMYFEVLRHFRVEQELANVQECLFIPLKMSLFDEKKVLRWKNSLRPAVAARKTFDPEAAELLRGFDATERIHTGYANLDMPKARYADDNFKAISGEITLKMWLNRPADTKIDAVVNPTTNVVTVPERWELNLPSWIKYNRCGNFSPSHIQAKFERVAIIDREAIFEKGLGNSIAQGILKKIEIIAVKGNTTQKVEFDIVIASTYKRGQPMRVLLRQANNTELLTRADFDYIDIQLPSDYHPGDVENSLVMVDSLRINYQTTHYNGTILSASGIEDDLGYNDKVRIYTPTNENEKRNPKNEDARLRSKLLNHFNTNIELYHQVLWWNMSAERRWMLLDGFIAPHSGGRSIASVVENRLMGIVGNCLVMPVAPGFHLDPTYTKNANETFSLLEHYRPTTPAPAFRISVPTPGLFTEAVQGACNSCEKIDNTRNWRFQENPIPDKPTQIQPVSLESRHDVNAAANLQTKDFAQPIVNIQNAPAAPDFNGTAGILGLMGKSDLFRDMAGLDQTQKNALAGLQEAYKSANASQKAAIDMVVQGGLPQMAQNAYMEKHGDRMLESLQKGVDDGMIDEDL
jgi:hypothetical protein